MVGAINPTRKLSQETLKLLERVERKIFDYLETGLVQLKFTQKYNFKESSTDDDNLYSKSIKFEPLISILNFTKRKLDYTFWRNFQTSSRYRYSQLISHRETPGGCLRGSETLRNCTQMSSRGIIDTQRRPSNAKCLHPWRLIKYLNSPGVLQATHIDIRPWNMQSRGNHLITVRSKGRREVVERSAGRSH